MNIITHPERKREFRMGFIGWAIIKFITEEGGGVGDAPVGCWRCIYGTQY